MKMNCPKCNNNLSYYKDQDKWFCHVCGIWYENEALQLTIKEKVYGLKDWENKGTVTLLSFITILIGTFIILIYLDIILIIPIIGYFLIGWGIVIPLFGIFLVLAGKYRSGGYLLIIGCGLWIPIGLIGVYGGIIALKIHKYKNL